MPTTRSNPLRALSVFFILLMLCVACSRDKGEPTGSSGMGAAAISSSTVAGGAGGAPAKDTLVWAWTGDLASLDPMVSAAKAGEMGYNLYETLLDYKVQSRPDGMVEWVGGEVAPMLAESWDISGAAVTFHLRKGVKFYPSKNELSADDVKWSFQRGFGLKGSVAPSNGVFAGLYKPDQQIEVVDKYTVRITFTDPEGKPAITPASLVSMAFYMFPIMDSVEAKKYVTADQPWAEKYLTDHSLGTGHYFVAARTPGIETTLQYVGDDYYWGKAPAFKRVILRVFANNADIVALLKQGQLDGALALPIPELENVKAAGLQVLHADSPDAVRYFSALEHPALGNKLVRQALAYAIPYDQVIAGIYGGRATRSYSIVNPKDPSVKPVLQKYGYDVNKAKDLLRQSGVRTPFSFTIFYDSGNAIQEDVALLLKNTWSKDLGLDVSVSGLPSAQFSQTRRERIMAVTAGQPTTTMSGIILNTGSIFLDDPQAIVEFWLKSTSPGSTNASGFKNAEVDELHAKWGSNGLDVAGRKAAYGRIQDIFGEELPMNVIVLQGTNLVLAKGLKGYGFVADNSPRYWRLSQ